ncbi:MAG: LysE family translocator [Planctomycetota bacterium]
MSNATTEMLADLSWGSFLTVTTLHLVAVATPGPDFILVTQRSLRHGRRAGLLCSAGIATGIPFHVAYCVLGLTVVLAQSPVAFTVFQLVAACYLVFMGACALRSTGTTVAEPPTDGEGPIKSTSFLIGLVTNVLNPKAALFFLALFSALGPTTSIETLVVLGLWMAVLTLMWFTSLTLLLTTERARAAFLKRSQLIDRAAGVIFILFGFGLLLTRLH